MKDSFVHPFNYAPGSGFQKIRIDRRKKSKPSNYPVPLLIIMGTNTKLGQILRRMGIKTGPKDERKLSFSQKLYFPEIFKGMWFSFKHMFRKKVTIQYPEQKPVLGPEFRGRPVLVKENGQERCVACGLCARACPPFAISMQASETPDQKERFPETFEINMLRCIYCGFCEDVCPEEAIVMSTDYDFNFKAREEAIYGKDKLMVEANLLKPRLEFLKKKRNPNYGEIFSHEKGNNVHSVKDR